MADPKVTSPVELAALQEQIRALNAQLADKDTQLEAVKSAAQRDAASQGMPFMQSEIREVPTGETVKVRVCKNPWVRKASEQRFEEVEMPTYWYKIMLPPSGGISLKINGQDFYHGQTYKFTRDDLTSIKDMCAKTWGHEDNIRGSNENVFRRPRNMVINGSKGQIQ